jgi:glycosyltransferase involved in cell wall biosynthesis
MIEKINERILIFIVAFNAEKTILNVLSRIPPSISKLNHQILIIDDCSGDNTFSTTVENLTQFKSLNIKVLFNPEKQGYGGNQKLGYHYAIENGFDLVVLLHGDGQYAPEKLDEMLSTIIGEKADAVIGSRMMDGYSALRAGMPLYKFFGNKILTFIQNKLLKTRLSEFHSGYRAYNVQTLKKIPFELNTNDFHFDTEILIQLILGKFVIREIPIPTYSGEEIRHFRGIRYAWDVLVQTLTSRFHQVSLFYERKFDIRRGVEKYTLKRGYPSSHEYAIKEVKHNSTVLDIGCGDSLVGMELVKKGCRVEAIDSEDSKGRDKIIKFTKINLNDTEAPIPIDQFDYILLLDVLEHLENPEEFVYNIRKLSRGKLPKIIVSVPNIGWFTMRLQLLLGGFNYGARGILDLGHRRLFTFSTIKAIFEQAGFKITKTFGVPAPYPLAIGNNFISKILIAVNQGLIKIFAGLFSYQIFLVTVPLPTVSELLKTSRDNSDIRIDEISRTL